MNDLNSVLIEGSLAADPHMSETEDGEAVCHFSINHLARDWSYAFRVCVYGNKRARALGETLKAGRMVRIVGRLTRVFGGVFISAEHVEIRKSSRSATEETPADIGIMAAREDAAKAMKWDGTPGAVE